MRACVLKKKGGPWGLGLGVLLLGCPGSDDEQTSTVAQETGSAEAGDDDDDDGTGSEPTAGDGTADDTGGTGTSDDGPDPTPEFECPEPDASGQYPASAIHVGNAIISSQHPSAIPVEDLEGIAIITRDLIIDKTNYEDLAFVKCIVEVQGHVTIFGNPYLTDVSGLNNLRAVGRLPAPNPTPNDPNNIDDGLGSITVSNNASLTDINGFNNVQQIGAQDPNTNAVSKQSLIIRSNDALQTITGFDKLALIFDSLIIQENPVLEDIDGLKSLQGVGGVFSVTRNKELCISSVICVGNGLTYLGNPDNSTQSQNNPDC